MIEVEVVHEADIGRHPFALPALDCGCPRVVDDRDTVGLLVREHAPEAFMGGHGGHGIDLRIVCGASENVTRNVKRQT